MKSQNRPWDHDILRYFEFPNMLIVESQMLIIMSSISVWILTGTVQWQKILPERNIWGGKIAHSQAYDSQLFCFCIGVVIFYFMHLHKTLHIFCGEH